LDMLAGNRLNNAVKCGHALYYTFVVLEL